jgi:glycosyltransferase involved in cell wall biosynthesis
VVIPAHNRERYLAEALESARTQGPEPVEVIVVDDGSTDATVAVARRFPDVRCISRRHGGAAAARNTGIAVARGEFLAFLDSDDVWLGGKTAWQLDALRSNPGVAMAFGWVQEFVSPDTPAAVRARIACPREPGPARCCPTMLIARRAFERVGAFDETLAAGEFIDWYSRAMAAGQSETMVERVVLRRRLHSGNLGFQRPALRHELVRAVHRHLKRREAGGDGG